MTGVTSFPYYLEGNWEQQEAARTHAVRGFLLAQALGVSRPLGDELSNLSYHIRAPAPAKTSLREASI